MGAVLQEAIAWYNLPLTVLLGVVALYWVMVIVGVLSADSLDLDVDAGDVDLDLGGDIDIDAHVDVDMEAEADVHHDIDVHHGSGGLGLAMLRFLNFGQVPAMVVISALTLCLWFFSLVANFAFNRSGDILLAMILFIVNVIVSAVVVKIATAPLKPLFRSLNRNFDTHEPIVGRECVIRSVSVTADEIGRAEVERDGASFLIRVRIAPGRDPLRKGDHALVLDYDAEEDSYLIKEFNTQ